MEKTKKKKIWLYTLILFLILLDQVSKFLVIAWVKSNGSINIIEGVLQFTYLQNTGGAYGIGAGNLFNYILINGIVLIIIIRFMITQKDKMDTVTTILLSSILAGGISNLIDRIFRGFVIDFIDFSPILSFPKFNIADICIVVGWVGFAFIMARYTAKELKNRKEEKQDKEGKK